MKPSFKGFEGYNQDTTGATTSQTANSTAELSGYDSSLSSRESSRETSPSNGLTPGGDTVQRKSQDNRSVVKRLVEHFSNSDSDTAGKASYTTRRKRSKTLQHTELPSGGEIEKYEKWQL